MDISIVVPVYNEEENLVLFYTKIIQFLNRINKNYEIIFVNDGSNDGSYKILHSYTSKNKNIKLINLTKRKGQLYALNKGVRSSKGEIIITMDADLQYAPYDIKKFLSKVRQGYDFVSGIRQERKDSFYRVTISKIANFTVRIFTGTKLNDLGCPFFALDKKLYQRIISKYPNFFLITKPILIKASANFTEIEVKHFSRMKGRPKNNLSDLFILFLSNLLSLSPYLVRFQSFIIRKIKIYQEFL